jgi:ABC-2 type transport system ATP-binding protein
MDAGPVLWCKDLRKRFKGRLAVDGVGFEVAPGETYGLLGPNGAGKTTTISMICGLLARDGGEVTVAGASLDRDPAQVKAAIGYVPQDVALYPDLSGLENLRFWGRMYGLAGRELGERVEATLEVVGLAERSGDRVDGYSGGMRRRLNIAAGLLHRPRLLVLDEPTAGVDPQSRNAILAQVEALGGEGVAVLYTTHYMEEAERLCDRVGIIDQGRLVAEGTRRELVATVGERDRVELAATGDLAGLAGAAARLDGVDEAGAVAGGVHLVAREGRRLLPRLLEAAEHAGAEVTSVELVEPDLEAAFLHLTGKALRD